MRPDGEQPTMGEPAVPPDGASFAISPDGQTATINLDDLSATAGVGTAEVLTREFSIAFPVTGDTMPAAVEVAVTGYAFAFGSRSRRQEGEGDVAGKLTVVVHERTMPFFSYANSSGEFTHPVAARLRGAPELRITLQLELRPDPAVTNFSAMLSVATIDVMFL
ncbi:hypothetical protein SAMN05421812_10661 [Asanoa hainanensis]|uniref:Uncharacterized protein n=1 Tax=Asanoa hainanensis TaxID=560556 RepID=A0A239MMM8_9ACTN|nr:hypothetical protein [Asanoa hainanensis]SNT43976.1 hypothetical protein SAMN05421812_10661 [Asanoa hainanensis]